MAVWPGGTSGNDYGDWSNQPLGMGETAHSMSGLDGNDTLIGGLNVMTFLLGGNGHDSLTGGNVGDFFYGDAGNDTMHGGGGDDTLVGGAGADRLYGELGDDQLWGGAGGDYYYVNLGEGNDTINDDLSPTGATGYGDTSTDDRLYITNQIGANLLFYSSGNDLWVTDTYDISDGFIDDQIVIEDFFLGGNNVVEYAFGADGSYWDLTAFL